VVEFRVSPDAFNNIHTGNIDHLLVEGNRCGSTAPFGQDIGGRIAYIKNCNLRNSLITGNTSVLPIPEDSLEFWPMSDGGALNLWHFALDTLYIENVEISHNQVLDHADYWAIVNAFGPDEAGSAHRGRGLLLQLGDTRQAILRNCIFHENRLSSAWPETNVALSVGSVLRTEGGTTYPPWRTKLLIEDCSFTDNDEGAVQVTGLVDYDIRNCVIRGPHRYGIWMGANTGRIENVLIDSVLARDYVGTFKPSQQCAIVFNSQMGTDAHNVTVTNCSVRNLLAGSSPWTPQANFNSGLVANNTFQSIETHWVLDPDYDQRVHFENCYLPIVPEDGTDNLIGSEPGFDSELGMPWLSAGSECIDSGTTDSLFADLEDPDNPGFALWPSQ
ncbi:MAG: hypothetical protein KDC10_16660, partial [Calditrichaeota bacterium]|nr:hypothetical protein [Calditrichota bacterium]